MSSKTYRSNSVNNGPSEPGDCVDSLPDSITLIPSLYAKYLLTCIGTYNVGGLVKSLINKFRLTNKLNWNSIQNFQVPFVTLNPKHMNPGWTELYFFPQGTNQQPPSKAIGECSMLHLMMYLNDSVLINSLPCI